MPLLPTLLVALLGPVSGSAEPQRQAVLVPMPAEASWQELAFLAALPAASMLNDGKPALLALGLEGALSAETKDFLARYHPARLTFIGSGPEDASVEGIASERLPASSADTAACALAAAFFKESARAVLVHEDDYSSALAGSVLAARLRVPLFFCGGSGLSSGARAQIERLGANTLLLVGDFEKTVPAAGKATSERLRQPADVARWMQKHKLPVEYVAAVAPLDRGEGHARKLSLAGAELAAGRGGALVPLERGSAADARAALAAFRAALGSAPEYLCLAALPEALPMEALQGSGDGVDTDPPSDLAYGNVDADPFLELAVGRFVAEDCASGTLLAARSLAYDELLAPAFAARFAMAEWERSCAPLFANVGFEPPALHSAEKPFEQDSALASVSVLVHDSHSSWLQIGNTYMHDSRVLLAPCLVVSAGCSPASLDQDADMHSVALRLLRNGAIGFVGNVRRAIAQQELYRSEFLNGLLAGQSLGRANRDAQNRMLVSMLAHGESEHGAHRYELYNQAFYGDPALVLHLPKAPKSPPARVELRGREVMVHAPAEWWRNEEFIVPDWKYDASPALYAWRGAGVGVESSWDNEHHRNQELHVFTAQVRTSKPVHALVALKPPAAPLGWDGKFFVDEHADGTRSVYFRVQLLDADMGSGRILQQVDELRFRLE